MLFRRYKQKLRKKYDSLLLQDIEQAKSSWDYAKRTQEAIFEMDEELAAEVALAKAKYHFLFLEAKRRNLKGKIQSSVISR